MKEYFEYFKHNGENVKQALIFFFWQNFRIAREKLWLNLPTSHLKPWRSVIKNTIFKWGMMSRQLSTTNPQCFSIPERMCIS